MGRRGRTRELIRGNNIIGEPTDCCCCTTKYCCCAVPSLLLKPGNTFGTGSSRAGRGARPPYSSRYSHHRGNCIIHSSSMEAMDTRAAVVSVCVLLRCPQLLVVPISALCPRNRTRIVLVSFYTKPIFHECVPRMAKISRYLTAI